MPDPLVYIGILPTILGKGFEATGSRARRDNGMKLCHTRNFAALHTHVDVTMANTYLNDCIYTQRQPKCFLYWLLGFATAPSCGAHDRSRHQWQPKPQIQIQARLPELSWYDYYYWKPLNFLASPESLFYMQKEKGEGRTQGTETIFASWAGCDPSVGSIVLCIENKAC